MQTIHRNDSYYEEYKRSRSQNENNPNRHNSKTNTHKLMTDRSSYMAFLEVELERVSAACMTVQGYKEQLSTLDTNHHELEDKLKRYSRALKLSSTMMERRDHETNHKFDNLESRLHSMERKQSSLETDAKMFMNGDLPSILNEVKQTVKRELVGITEKYAAVERRCNEMITDRLDGYTDVYSALEKKLGNVMEDNLGKYKVKMVSNNEEIKEWMRKYMKQCSTANMDAIASLTQRIKSVEEAMTQRLDRLEHQILREQPEYIKGFIAESIENRFQRHSKETVSSASKRRADAMNSINSKDSNLLNLERMDRAEKTCTKIADDVYKRLQSQRSDLFEHIKSVEQRIGNQLKQTIEYLTERDLKQNKVEKQQNRRVRSRSDEPDPSDPERIDLNSLRNEILDYRSEMVHSQRKLSDLEDTFTAKLKKLQNETTSNSNGNSNDHSTRSAHSKSSELKEIQSVHQSQKLKDLDRKYSEIQNSIRGLQQMLNEHDPNTKRNSLKKRKKRKCKTSRNSKSSKSSKPSKRRHSTVSATNRSRGGSKSKRKTLNEINTNISTSIKSDQSSTSPMAHRLETDLPKHLGPHLSDLDNLVQCVFEADRIDKKHSEIISKTRNTSNTADCIHRAKLHKKRKRKTSCPESSSKTQWR